MSTVVDAQLQAASQTQRGKLMGELESFIEELRIRGEDAEFEPAQIDRLAAVRSGLGINHVPIRTLLDAVTRRANARKNLVAAEKALETLAPRLEVLKAMKTKKENLEREIKAAYDSMATLEVEEAREASGYVGVEQAVNNARRELDQATEAVPKLFNARRGEHIPNPVDPLDAHRNKSGRIMAG